MNVTAIGGDEQDRVPGMRHYWPHSIAQDHTSDSFVVVRVISCESQSQKSTMIQSCDMFSDTAIRRKRSSKDLFDIGFWLDYANELWVGQRYLIF